MVDTSINFIGFFVITIVVGLLVGGLFFVFRFTKVSAPAAWAFALGVLLIGLFLFFGLGTASLSLITLVVLLGVPVAGLVLHRLAISPDARRIAVVAGTVLAVAFAVLILVQTARISDFTTRNEQLAVSSVEAALLKDQAAMARQLREAEDRQRRELFESQHGKFVVEDVSTSDSAAASKQIDVLKASPGVAWYPEVDERFPADIQPSMAATGRALGQKLLGLMKTVTKNEDDPSIIQIHAARVRHTFSGMRATEECGDALNELAAVMRSRYPEAQVLVEQVSPTYSVARLDPNAVSIELKSSVVHLKTAPWDTSTSELLADVTAELDIGSRKASVSVRLVDKPWVHDFDQFLASNQSDSVSQKNSVLIDARSGRLATSELEARNSAIEDAVNMLTPVAMEVLKTQRQPLLRTPDETEIADRLKAELLGGQLIADRFSQQLAHPMGSLWREAILVRADYGSMQRIISGFVQQRQKEERGQLSLAAALALLALGIVVLHAVLNAITKGYYRKNVGMLSGILAVAGILVTLVMALRFLTV